MVPLQSLNKNPETPHSTLVDPFLEPLTRNPKPGLGPLTRAQLYTGGSDGSVSKVSLPFLGPGMTFLSGAS